jgi:protein gp37
MTGQSSIEWTDATWNPIVGCSIVSPGCTNCYAMGMAGRIEAMTAALRKEGKTGAPHYDGTTRKVNGNTIWTGKVARAPEAILTEPLAWKRPRKIFVNSMGDLFHEDVPDEWIDRVFAVMALAPQHTFQVLTKRTKRMREYFAFKGSQQLDRGGGEDKASAKDRIFIEAMLIANRMEGPHEAAACVLDALERWPLPNVWLGVSAERQQEADERIPELLATPAAIRFVSAEPLLGPIDFERIKLPQIINPLDALRGMTWQQMTHGRYAGQRLYSGLIFGGDRGLDWIIVGGESGPDARPMHPAWPRLIRDQCAAAGVPFFFKQWGAWLPGENLMLQRPVEHAKWQDGETGRHSSCRDDRDTPEWRHYEPGGPGTPGAFGIRLGKKAAGRLLDGAEHNGLPQLHHQEETAING